MKNVILIAIFASLVGCATNSDVKALDSRVTALESAHAKHESDIAQLKANDEKTSADIANLGKKLDAAFVKKNTK